MKIPDSVLQTAAEGVIVVLQKEALEKLTKPDAEAYLQQEKERLLAWSVTFIDEQAEIMRTQLKNQALSQITTERELLQEESRLAEWKEIYRQLQ